MEKSHVKTFYNNLADEVDQHFARALQSATTPVQSQGGPNGGDTTCWAHQPPQHMGQQPYHTDFGAPYPASPSSSPNSGGEISVYPESVYPNVNSSVFPPPPSFVTGNPNSPSLICGHPNSGGTIVYPESSHHHDLVYPDINSFAGPPPPSFITDNSNSRGTIIYPEFVEHLVHPDVDSFKDIPKLPGQTDPRGRY